MLKATAHEFQNIIFHAIISMKIEICFFQNVCLLLRLTEGKEWNTKKRALKGLFPLLESAFRTPTSLHENKREEKNNFKEKPWPSQPLDTE